MRSIHHSIWNVTRTLAERGIRLTTLLLIAMSVSIHVNAQTTWNTVDFSNQANFTWTGAETDPDGQKGIYMPGGPNGNVTLGGVPFNIKSNSNGYQAWNAWYATGGTGSGQVSITIPVGVYGVTNAYTLLNTYWGSGTHTSLLFTGSAGATYSLQFTDGQGIRNWLGASGPLGASTSVNVYTTHTSQIANPGGLDMQEITLPTAFATQTLTSVELIDSGASGLSRDIIDGLTVASVPLATPEPGAYAFATVLCLTAAAILLRRRKYVIRA